MIIDDGMGKGKSAHVDSSNRLTVSALTETQAVHQAHLGNVFAINTGVIALTTTASYTGILYIHNGSTDKDVKIDLMRFSASTPCDWRIIKQSSTGTLITAGTEKIPVQVKFDSGNAFNGTVLAGSDAQTVTDGEVFIDAVGQPGVFADIDGIIIITPKTNLAVSVKPSAACNVAIGMFVWQATQDE